MKYLTTTIFVLFQFILFSQSGKLDFSFIYANQKCSMPSLNSYLHDSNFDKAFLFKEDLYLQQANKLKGQITQQLWKNLNLGLFVCYQNSRVIINHQYSVFDPINNTTTDYSYDYSLKANNVSFGTTASTLYHEIFNFRGKGKILNRLQISNNFYWGIAKSNLRSSQVGITPQKYEVNEYDLRSIHFMGDISLNIGYEFLHKPILSSMGVTVGYQFNKSGIVRNIVDQSLRISDDSSVNLDFSGLYFGLYLSIGK